MHCSRFTDPDVPERYLRGELDEASAAAFEEHYFECEACFEALKELRELSCELERNRLAIEKAARPRILETRWAVLTAVSVVFLGALLAFGLLRHGHSVRDNPLAELGRVEVPDYVSVRLRGTEGEGPRRFHDAMELYANRDWTGALPGLHAAARLEPESVQILYYLGATQLLAGETGEAIATLTRAVALGESPYLEESRFYLGKAYLQSGDAEAARVQFVRVLELQGTRHDEAKELLEKLSSFTRSGP